MKEKSSQSGYLSYTGICCWPGYDLSSDLDGNELL